MVFDEGARGATVHSGGRVLGVAATLRPSRRPLGLGPLLTLTLKGLAGVRREQDDATDPGACHGRGARHIRCLTLHATVRAGLTGRLSRW